MNIDDAVVVSLTVVTDNHEHILKAAEVMGRAGAGLVLDGITVSLSMGRGDAEPVED